MEQEQIKNYGLVIDEPRPEDYKFGAVGDTPLNSSGDWTDYLPERELQNKGFETFACVTFSALNCLETLVIFKYDIPLNLSDRFTAKMSGTTNKGNSGYNVANSIRHDGFVDEPEYPFGGKTFAEFYADIPQDIVDLAKEMADGYEVNYEWVQQSEWKEALKFAPLQVYVGAWPQPDEDGIYPKSSIGINHAVMLYKIDDEGYYYIYDHYDNVNKKLAPDFIFYPSAIRYSINNKNMIQILKVKDSPHYYLVGNGKKKMIVDYVTYKGLLELGFEEVQEVDNLEDLEPAGTIIQANRIIN